MFYASGLGSRLHATLLARRHCAGLRRIHRKNCEQRTSLFLQILHQMDIGAERLVRASHLFREVVGF